MPVRTAVVTGATGTLGSSVVAALAERGMAVLAVSRSGEAPGAGEVVSVAADLSSDTCVPIIRDALPTGSLSMVVHAVGLPGSPDVLSVEPRLLAEAVDIKCGGLLRLLRAIDASVGNDTRVVAVGGHMGDEPTARAPLAGVANAGLANLVRQLTHPLGRRGASIHLIAPGPFDSPRVDALIERHAAAEGRSVEESRAEFLSEYPRGEMPSARDVAWAIAMLDDPSAAALTGSTLFMDGGVRRGIF